MREEEEALAASSAAAPSRSGLAGEGARRLNSPLQRPSSPRTDSFEETSSDPTGSKEDSGGGNEPDVEDAADEAMMTPADGSSEERINVEEGGRAMYPFPPPSLAEGEEGLRRRWARRGSSAVVEASSATASDEADDDERMGSVEGGAGSLKERRKRGRTRRSFSALPFDASLPPHPAPPPRLRRIGALGISVHSDSDDQDNPAVSGLDSEDLRKTKEGGESSDTRATDLGISTSQLRSSNEDLTGRRKKKRRRVGDSTFRGVVDDLVLQNRELKGRLKRYEARGIPDELKRDRLFEIRFGPALPLEKRLELETYLTNCVQDLAQHPDEDLPLPPLPRSAPHALPTVHSRSPSPRRQSAQFYLGEKQLAGPSNSGVEPVSMTGTGSGMVLPPPPMARPLPLQPGTPPASIDTPADEAIAREIVASLELLFYHSLIRSAAARSPIPLPPTPVDADNRIPSSSAFSHPTSPTIPCPSNETYFSNLLSHDYLSQGFVYTNLACTMAQIHRFPVTLAFVQQAIRQFSTRLEVSDDGGRMRWVGPRDLAELKRDMGGVDDEQEEKKDGVPPLTTAADETMSRSSGQSLRSGNLQRLSSANGSTSAGRDRSSGTATSSRETVSSLRDPSSGEGAAPTTAGTSTGQSRSTGRSTAATSQYPSSGPDSGKGSAKAQGKGKEVAVEEEQRAKPVRPVAAVLQPMARLRESSGGSGSSGEKEKIPTPAAERNLNSANTVDAVHGSAAPASGKSTRGPPIPLLPASASYRAKNLFDRLQEADEEGKTLSGVSSGRSGLSAPAHGVSGGLAAKDVTRTGTLVFYANGHFCSDLSKEEQPVPPALPTPPDDEVDGKAVVLGASEEEKVMGPTERRRSEDESARMSLEDDSGAPSSGLLDVEMGDSRSPSSGADGQSGDGSGTSSFERLKTSGMTTTKPADLFTLVVKSQYPLTAIKRPLDARSSISLGDEEGADIDSVPPPFTAFPLKKRRLLPVQVPRILSTETVYHSATSKKRDPFELAFLSSSSLVGSGSTPDKTSEEELSDEEERADQVQHLLTSSNLALLRASQIHPHLFDPSSSSLPPAPHLVPIPPHLLSTTPSPPHDDYLLSLSAPSHAWAPREPGLNSRAGTVALSMKAGSLQLDLGGGGADRGGESIVPGGAGEGLLGRGGALTVAASSVGGTTMISTGDERPISLDEMVGLTKAQVAAGMVRREDGQQQ